MTATVALIAATFGGNHGAEAMALTAIGRIRDRIPDARIEFFSYYPVQDSELVQHGFIRIHSCTPINLVTVLFPGALVGMMLHVLGLRRFIDVLPKSVRALARADVLVDLAGVSFVDGREKFLPFNVLTILCPMLLGIPVVKFSQALGSFDNRLNRSVARIMLPRCTAIFSRGSRTLANLTGLGLEARLLQRANDAAFLLESRDRLTVAPSPEADRLVQELEYARTAGRVVVGICPSSVVAKNAGWDYVGYLAALVKGQLANGRVVLLFPNATRADGGDELRNNDLPIIRAVRSRLESLDQSRFLYVDGDLDAIDIKRLVALCDVVAVSRFHAMVAALSIAVPVIVIGWSHKYLEVMALFNLERYVFELNDTDTARVTEHLEELVAETELVSDTIRLALDPVKKESLAQFETLFELLEA